MDIEDVMNKLSLKNKKVLNRSSEYSRLIKVKRPMGLGPLEMCKPGACIFVACKELSIELNKSQLVRILGTNDKLFEQSILALYTILGKKRPPYSIVEISNTFKLNSTICESSENLLKLYRTKILGGIEEVQSQFTNIDDGIFSAASVYIMTQQHSINIDHTLLLSLVDCSQETFQRAMNAITQCCYQGESIVKLKKTPPKNKQNTILRSPTSILISSSSSSSSSPLNNTTTSTTTTAPKSPIPIPSLTPISQIKNLTTKPIVSPSSSPLLSSISPPKALAASPPLSSNPTTDLSSTNEPIIFNISSELLPIPPTTTFKNDANENKNNTKNCNIEIIEEISNVDESPFNDNNDNNSNNKNDSVKKIEQSNSNISNKKRSRDELEKESEPPQQQQQQPPPPPPPQQQPQQQQPPQQQKENSVKNKINEGDLTLEQERLLIKKKKEQQFNDWKNSDFAKSKPTPVNATKQLTLDSFFK
ncbi:hypothetical protein ACTFIW_007204 [Dictyostelium discoideum]